MADEERKYPGEEEEDEEDEIDETGYKTAKDAVLFAIDVSKTMLTPPPESNGKKDSRDTPTVAALKCAYALMQQRIISNPNDMMGILLFGTEKSKFQEGEEDGRGGLQYPHCYLLTDLDVPAAADVKQLRNLVQDEEEAASLLVASDEEVSMANVLFCANQIFTTKAPSFSSRRLFLVTDNDLPHASNRDARNSAAVRAKDLYDLGVIIELFPISRPDHEFDRSRFYNDIVYSTTPTDPDAPMPLTSEIKSVNAADGISLLQSLLSSIASRATPRRALFSNLPFEIGPGLKTSVKGFIIIKRQEPKRTSYVYLPSDDEKPKIAVGSSTLMAEDTARTVEKVEVRKAYRFGGETISFSADELAKIKNFGDPVLRIIGFKPISLLPVWANTKQCTFIYPSEEDFIGSTRVFSALQQKLLKDDKIGIAWFVPRRNATPVLAALLPGAEQRDEEGSQTMPPGLWIRPLPFADDIREPPETSLVKAPDELIDRMRIIVQQLQLPGGKYVPSKYPNPSLQWFYRILQALALDEDMPEHAEDKTLPRWKQIHKRAGQYVIDWGTELDQYYQAWQKDSNKHVKPTATGAAKRTKAEASASAAPKKVKKEDGEDEVLADADMKAAYEKNTLNKLTIAVLKQWLQAKGVNLKGISKKADLVEQVTKYYETRMDID